MDSKKIKRYLKDYPGAHVEKFLQHVQHKETERKSDGSLSNPWFRNVTEEDLSQLFKIVSSDGVYIDGKSVSLAWKSKKLTVNYDYQAYKNRLLHVYPETEFDIQNVYKADKFVFHKKDGAVSYSHDIIDPFDTSREIVGAYCIIKNKRGQFIETVNMADIQKMRSHSNFKKTWEEWFDRMVLKSVIKRGCKSHFDDVTGDIDAVDNLDYDLNNETPEKDVFEQIEEFKKTEDLFAWASSSDNQQFANNDEFRSAVKKKSVQLKQDKDEPQIEENGKG
jgi:hypothetical protein